jgi:hypothetical protein
VKIKWAKIFHKKMPWPEKFWYLLQNTTLFGWKLLCRAHSIGFEAVAARHSQTGGSGKIKPKSLIYF